MSEELERELRATQEMLFLVLSEVGRPVNVSTARINAGIDRDQMINVELDEDAQQWVFSVKEVESE